MARFAWPKQQRGQRRAERKRVERGEKNRDGDRDGELLVEPSGDSGNEGRGHEYSGKNQSNSDDGTGEFLHRFQRCVLWRHALLDVPLHALDYDDRVIDHQTNRQHQPEERKRIDGKTEQREKHERAHQRNGHGQQRNQRGAPALKEKIDDKDHEDEGDQERLRRFP